ncbi:MAG: hypothetical protein HZB66_03330 [Candidatus Aenigmarchaeota archaeon]|nr:hypothetical protein [Candidatus Aenigmarchaeota archaeon]
MEMKIERGFVVYTLGKLGKGDVFVVLHSGPQYGTYAGNKITTPRDTGADIISSIASEKFSSSLVFSGIPRNPFCGIDFNRLAPTPEEALRFSKARDDELKAMMDRYAWACSDENDYNERMALYRNFWDTVSSLGDRFFLIHVIGLKLAHIPTIMDIITFDSRGISMQKAQETADMMTEKFSNELEIIADYYRKAMITDYNLNFCHMWEHTPGQREWLDKDISFLRKIGLVEEAEELEKGGMEKQRFLDIVEKVTENVELRVTVEHTFSGKKAFAPKKELLDKGKVAIEIEVSRIMQHFPDLGSEMLLYLAKLA